MKSIFLYTLTNIYIFLKKKVVGNCGVYQEVRYYATNTSTIKNATNSVPRRHSNRCT